MKRDWNPTARRVGLVLAATLLVVASTEGVGASPQTSTARQLYEAAQAADHDARTALAQAPDRAEAALAVARDAVRKYRLVVLRFPSSGFCDDALWYGALLSADAFGRFGQDRDRQSAVTLFKWLRSQYPASPFVQKLKPRLDRLDTQPAPVPARPAVSAPSTPSVNSRGGFSMARQLGLRVGKVVIDPGHGGQDPGAISAGVSESSITLDIALKLEALLTQTTPLEVVLTRRTDVHVGLPERTAIANRENADLFVSIHVNANSDPTIRGVETFLLNFASTPGAAAVAARENASSTMTMNSLNDVVRQIALTNKIDESRDLAVQLQSAMVGHLKTVDKGMKDLGVKQAPFVVLVGASMPSVLVETAFLTNRQEGQLLETPAYRQRIAESLADGIARYLRALKKGDGVSGPPAAVLR